MALGKRGLAIMVVLILGVQLTLASRCDFPKGGVEGERDVSNGNRGNRKLLFAESSTESGESDEASGELNAELSNTSEGRRELTTDGGRIITAFTEKVTLAVARQKCKEQNLVLMPIVDKSDRDAAWKACPSVCWVDVFQDESDPYATTPRWLTKNKIGAVVPMTDATLWTENEPNGGTGEKCVVTDGPSKTHGGIADVPCSWSMPYLCTSPPPPAPGPVCSVTIQSVTPYPAPLHVGEIQLFDDKGPLVPLAADLSNTLYPFTADKCIDGDENTFCHSRKDPNNFIKVSYTCRTGCSTSLSRINIVNRKDCCQWRLKGYTVTFANAAGEVDQPIYMIKDTGLRYTIPIVRDAPAGIIQYIGATPPTCSVTIKPRESIQWVPRVLALQWMELYDKSGARVLNAVPSPQQEFGCEREVIDGTRGRVCTSRPGDLDPVYMAYYSCPSGKSSHLSKVVVTSASDKTIIRRIGEFVLELRDSNDIVDQPIQDFPTSDTSFTNTFWVK